MNKPVLFVLAGTIALLTGSCKYFSDFADARREIEENAAKPIPVKVNTSPTTPQPTTDESPFADLEEKAEPVQEIAGLIPATNPDTRVRNSVRGRTDPFSVVTLTPQIEIEIEEEEVQQATNNNRTNLTNRESNRSKQESNNSNSENLPTPAVEVFNPTLAKNVIISGLYQSNGTTKLIVQAPEESTSRYVEVGQYLSNGQVLVKSIDGDRFPTPMVILEQAGVEVAKTIGGNPGDEPGSEISSLPTEDTQDQALLSNVSLSLK